MNYKFELKLLSEAQWEKAARGVDGRIYPWGNEDPNETLANFNREVKDTTPVGKYTKGASPYGVMDMAGNVWEWIADCYDANYYQNCPYKNPIGSTSGGPQILRGGSWNDDTTLSIRSAYRNWYYSAALENCCGFRCALLLK